MAGGILGLDIARRTGWAVADRPAIDAWPRGRFLDPVRTPRPAIVCGTATIAPPAFPHGYYMLAFENWLFGMFETHRPIVIAVESSIAAHKGGKEGKNEGIEQALRSIGLLMLTKKFCAETAIVFLEFHNSTVKSQFSENGRAEKPEMMDACRRRGWPPADDNAADGCGVLECAVRVLKHHEDIQHKEQRPDPNWLRRLPQ